MIMIEGKVAVGFILCLLYRLSEAEEIQVIVGTKYGLVKGSQSISSNNRTFLAFRGIPYARPPIGDLRFQDPVEITAWTGTLDATREAPACLQFDDRNAGIKGQEDCLYLNIYSHTVNSSFAKRPVMVWIHGGVWFMGSGNGESDMFGPEYLMDRDIVLVTLNYRLGPFGFLSTDDEVAPGNYGLLDQSMALRWVKDNIEVFGGDSNSITLFGESAGAASVEYHIISPRSQGLFNRAIIQSGSALCSWAFLDSVKVYTNRLAMHLNCSTDSSQEIVSCLRNRNASSIAEFNQKLKVIAYLPVAFGPRMDKERKNPFVPKLPKTMLLEGNFNHVPLIIGLNKNEAAFMVAILKRNGGSLMKTFDNNLAVSLPYAFGEELKEGARQRGLRTFKYYFKDLEKPSQNGSLLEQMLSDGTLFKCCQDALLIHARYQSPVYAYWFTHRVMALLPSGVTSPPPDDLGVAHGDEMNLIFKNRFIGPLMDEDKKAATVILDFWTSFAKDKAPVTSNLVWPPTTPDQSRYVVLSTTPTVVNSTFPFTERMKFWDNYTLPEYRQK